VRCEKSKYSAKGSGAVLTHCFVLPFVNKQGRCILVMEFIGESVEQALEKPDSTLDQMNWNTR